MEKRVKIIVEKHPDGYVAYSRLLHKSWHVIVTRTPTFRVANASQNSPCSIRPCHDCRPLASVAYPHHL